jgi:arginine exporter protein ArgO
MFCKNTINFGIILEINLSKKNKEEEQKIDFERKPWIERTRGLQVIGLAGILLGVLVAYQIIRGSGNWGQGILWGFIFGGSVFLVYFGMNAFHKFMNKNKENDSDQKK